jgi:hypothetical protein
VDASRAAFPAIWPWVLFALLVSFSASVASPFAPVSVGPAHALPLLTAWLAYWQRWRVVPVLLALTFPAAIGIDAQIAEFVSVSYGLRLDTFLLAIGAALAFAAPSPRAWPEGLVLPTWRWSLLGGAILLWAIGALGADLTLFTTEESRGHLNPLPVALALPFVTFRWREALARGRERGAGAGAVATAFVLAALTLGVWADLSAEWLQLCFGYTADAAWSILSAGAFLIAAAALIDWRPLAGVLALLLALENLFSVATTGADYLPRLDLFSPISAVLLGAALGPFWRSRGACGLAPRRAAVFLLALLTLQALALPNWYDALVTGGIAFLGGLVWRFRGLVALPAALGLLHAARLLTSGEALDAIAALTVQLGAVGFHAFVFAFFGLLSRRFASADEDAGGAARARETAA